MERRNNAGVTIPVRIRGHRLTIQWVVEHVRVRGDCRVVPLRYIYITDWQLCGPCVDVPIASPDHLVHIFYMNASDADHMALSGLDQTEFSRERKRRV